ncbi:MAG: hypothetical protein K2W82_14470 [Candidatus Obscuribacterales bacterium]|nr:hypothetical protein [Candidatus Obscuribacterales bacterium]
MHSLYILALVASLVFVGNPALAQIAPSVGNTSAAQRASESFNTSVTQFQTPAGTGTILPTDSLPSLIVPAERSAFENFHIKVLQKLPPKFYATGTMETSLRLETNPYQFPTKRTLIKQFLPQPSQMRLLNSFQQGQIYDIIGKASVPNLVMRLLPNVTGGWAFTPNTRATVNYFMIRDQLSHSIVLNTVVHSLSGGIQHDFRIGSKANLLADFQCRELWQLHQQPVFDFLPSLSFSYPLTDRTLMYTNVLMQLRGKGPFVSPNREIDPFYSFGLIHQRNGWFFSASGTLFQAFREPFGKSAIVRQDSYTWIATFEVARRVLKSVPGLQAFARVEPIWNFHSNNTPGLAGMDFRLFTGLRFAAAKKPIGSLVEQIRNDLREDVEAPTSPPPGSNSNGPGAMLIQSSAIADAKQTIHGPLPETQEPEEPSVATASFQSAVSDDEQF